MPVQIDVLGPLVVRRDGRTVSGLRGYKAQALLAYLALSVYPVERAVLADMLWPDLRREAGRTELSRNLHSIRRALPGLIVRTGTRLSLDPQALDVDRARFDELVATDTAESLDSAVLLVRGELLAGLEVQSAPGFGEWLDAERRASQVGVTAALERLVTLASAAGDDIAALAWARRWADTEPYGEAAHRAVIRLLAARGQRSAALAHAETLARRLADDLGVEPDDATRSLVGRVRSGDVGPRGAPVLAGLPVVLTAVVGQQQVLDEVVEALSDPGCRCLTLTGPAGVGKTRLAIGAAARLERDTLPGGVAFAELAPVVDASLVGVTIARAIGAVGGTGRNPFEMVRAVLRGRRVVLVLDNCEHLPGMASTVLELLRDCPGLQVLSTSRGRLGMAGERVVVVPPLDRPQAVELFLERAEAVRPGVSKLLDVATLQQLCDRLDGLPLAIELTAARTQVAGLDDILTGLESDPGVLRAVESDRPERHHGLGRAIDWSYELLSATERRAFERLSAFGAAGFTVGTARPVLTIDEDESSTHTVPVQQVDLLIGALADKALLQPVLDISRPEPRFAMLPSFAAYARRRLADRGQTEVARVHHALARVMIDRLRPTQAAGPEQWAALHAMLLEMDNYRTAVSWFVEHGPGDLLAELVLSGRQFLRWYAFYTEGLRWTEAALDRSGLSQSARGRLLLQKINFSFVALGDFAAVADLLDRHAAECALAGERELVDLHSLTAQSRLALDDLDGARRQAQAGLEVSRRIGFDEGSLVAHGELSLILAAQGRPDEAVEHSRQAHELSLSLRDTTFGFLVEVSWGYAELAAGNLAAAQRHLARTVEFGQLDSTGHALLGLSVVQHELGRHEVAARLRGAVTGELARRGLPDAAAIRAQNDPVLPALRAVLSESSLTALLADGEKLSRREIGDVVRGLECPDGAAARG